MSKSPLRKHNKIQKKINWFQNKKSKLDPEQPDYHEAQSNFDEQIEALRKDIPAAEAAHTKKRTEEEDTQVIERHLNSWSNVGFIPDLQWYGASADFMITFTNLR